jgi:uncharacterized protein (DUF2147 family)
VLLAAVGSVGSVRAEQQVSPEGLWWAEGGAAQVRVAPCDEELCAHVEWLRSPFDDNGCVLVDTHNPDPGLRARRVQGMRILEGLVRNDPRSMRWTGGVIYDPGSGRSYQCTLTLAGPNRIELRGYIGIPLLGRSTSWFRVGSELERCEAHGERS